MFIAEILLLAGLALLLRLVAAPEPRRWLVFAASVVCVYWLQPATPVRTLDYWLPTATLALTALGWLLTAPPQARRERKSHIAAALLVGLAVLVGFTRYLGDGDWLTPSRPPAAPQVVSGLAAAALVFVGLAWWLKRRDTTGEATPPTGPAHAREGSPPGGERAGRPAGEPAQARTETPPRKPAPYAPPVRLLGAAILLLIALLLALKTPALALEAGRAFRGLVGQNPALATALDVRWLGFSYVCFRLIHTLRDRQLPAARAKLPAVDLVTYTSYVVFFPAFVAGPIDRLERFAKDFGGVVVERSQGGGSQAAEAAARIPKPHLRGVEEKSQRLFSFLRSAWERLFGRSASRGGVEGRHGTQSVPQEVPTQRRHRSAVGTRNESAGGTRVASLNPTKVGFWCRCRGFSRLALPRLASPTFGIVAQPVLRPPFLADAGLADDLTEAGRRLALGLFKKFAIADTLALIALSPGNALQVQSSGWMWLLVYLYALQIYFDFSGYTDVAIGLGRLMGVRLPENFAAPYLKPNLTQFWNSWHMSLTQWFRAYFFNPFVRWLRSGKPLHPTVMLFLTQVSTMLLIGLWHGVTVNFVLWGLWHGAGLFVQNRWTEIMRPWFAARQAEGRLAPWQHKALQAFTTLLTFHYVALGWVWFALPTPQMAGQVLLRLFGMGG